MQQSKRVTINVSGSIFETYESTLNRFPGTLLGNKEKRKNCYCPFTKQYFINQNRACFEAILYFYQSNGRLICPPEVQVPMFEAECRYYEIPRESINKMKVKEGIIFDADEDVIPGVKQTFKMRVWDIFEKPHTSRLALTFGIFSLTMVWISTITVVIETIPMSHFNEIHSVEMVLDVWFLIELVSRLIFAQDRRKFIHGAMNIIDLLSILPCFLMFILSAEHLPYLDIFKTLKVIRVLRLLRLSKHSRRLRVGAIILRACIGNLKVLIICLVSVIMFGGYAMHYAEGWSSLLGFTSIPQSLWWSVQTVTAVGYGDLIPKTPYGRMFACSFMLFGGLITSLPVLSILSQIMTLYPKNVEYNSYIKTHATAKRQDRFFKKKHEGVVITNELARSGNVLSF